MSGHDVLRRVQNMLSRGELNKITDDKTPTAKVKLMSDEVYDNMEFPQSWGFASRPLDGAEVITAHFGGNRDHGTILNVFDKRYYPSELEDGDTMLYNATNSYIKIKANGDIVIAACKDPSDEQDDKKRDLHEPTASITLTKAGAIVINSIQDYTIEAQVDDVTVASIVVNNDGSVAIEATTEITATVDTSTVTITDDSINVEASLIVKLTSATEITLDAPQVNILGNLNVTTINGGGYPPL